MLNWLESDLATTERDWIIAFWHHPPYSLGTHPSDLDLFETEMRERALPILERYGVDLVLSGHSHVYERSFLLNGHYGYSSNFNASMALDRGLGQPLSGGPYRKPAGGAGANRGTVYTVCGCSGQGGDGDFPLHPVMATNSGGFGSVAIDVDGLVLRARFLRRSSGVQDFYTIDKSAPLTVGPALQIRKNSSNTILEWPTSIPALNLERSASLSPTNWQTATNKTVTTGRRIKATLPDSGVREFFQLATPRQ